MTTMLILIRDGSYQNFATMSMVAAGAVSSDIEVKVFAMEDAVYALKKDQIDKNIKFEKPYPEYNSVLQEAVDSGKSQKWWELVNDLKELGDIEITVCALVTDLLGLEKEDFADVVDDIQGVAKFAGDAEEADIFITL